MRVLFVCRGNVCRSRVGARIFETLARHVAERDDHESRSAGTEPYRGGRAVTGRDVEWADVICVMEVEHEAFIRARWPAQAAKIRVVGIPDIYQPHDAELHDRLTKVVRRLLIEGLDPEERASPLRRRALAFGGLAVALMLAGI